MPYANRDDKLENMRAYWRTPEGREKREAAQRAWRERNREKVRAHSAVHRALKKGTLIRPLECEGCGPNYSGKLEAHHDDYSKPLEIKWLCDSCHKLRHIELRLEARPYQDMKWNINNELGYTEEPAPLAHEPLEEPVAAVVDDDVPF